MPPSIIYTLHYSVPRHEQALSYSTLAVISGGT